MVQQSLVYPKPATERYALHTALFTLQFLLHFFAFLYFKKCIKTVAINMKELLQHFLYITVICQFQLYVREAADL